jgi:hypothetical protein
MPLLRSLGLLWRQSYKHRAPKRSFSPREPLIERTELLPGERRRRGMSVAPHVTIPLSSVGAACFSTREFILLA